jgi:HAD superfamily hydrolase (TIGR01509 family)
VRERGPEEQATLAVVFDLDGVLIESEPVWDRARREVVAEAGGRWHPGATRAMMGMSSPEWAAYLRDELGVALEEEQIVQRVVDRLLATYERSLPLLEGAVEVVRRMAAVWPLGLASSANRVVIDRVLALAEVADCFAATVSGEEVEHGKPAPDVYLAAAGALGVDPRAAVAVEDSGNGLRSAAGAGMGVVAVPNRRYPPDADAMALADVALASLSELTPAVVARIARRSGCG